MNITIKMNNNLINAKQLGSLTSSVEITGEIEYQGPFKDSIVRDATVKVTAATKGEAMVCLEKEIKFLISELKESLSLIRHL